MALLEKELVIKEVGELLNMTLKIPDYQRPYRWSEHSTNTLFNDTYSAFEENISEYRLGSLILHKHPTVVDGQQHFQYAVVDGQQRLTTLVVLLYCLGEKNQSLLNEKYQKQSNQAILHNFSILKKRVAELEAVEQQNYKEYLLTKCSIVQIVTDNESEAFQFFDSQNSRGKTLAPHDLLKAYHLREMNKEPEVQKLAMIEYWEAIDQNDLSNLFKNYLYPATQWYKSNNGMDYSSSKIDAFKGIKSDNQFNYAIYHRASHLFLEDFNVSKNRELMCIALCNQFQLTQPIIAGKRFFDYTKHYHQLLKDIQGKITEEIPAKGTGDRYVKQLYECALIFFVDRFGFEYLSKAVLMQLYTWCYSFRLVMQSVYLASINKYAQGKHERMNEGLALFAQMSEMKHPDEMKMLRLSPPKVDDRMKKKYANVYATLCEYNGWGKE